MRNKLIAGATVGAAVVGATAALILFSPPSAPDDPKPLNPPIQEYAKPPTPPTAPSWQELEQATQAADREIKAQGGLQTSIRTNQEIHDTILKHLPNP